MTRIAIVICDRYRDCGGGKCFRALRERRGAFARYAADEPVEIVGFTSCGGCPGGNGESVLPEFRKNGADVVHLATGLVVGYPPCPHLRALRTYVETVHGLPVVVGTHPIPKKYLDAHRQLTFWTDWNMDEVAGDLLREPLEIMAAYD